MFWKWTVEFIPQFVMFSGPCVCLFVIQQDHGETTGPIFNKIGRRVKNGSRKNPTNFITDHNQL